MKGIYLAAYLAKHTDHNIDYQDINGKRDIDGDMMDVKLDNYDFIIATPPFNYYSRANYRRETSVYIVGRHTYWTNILMMTDHPQKQDFVQHGKYIGNKDSKDDATNTREGGWNVHQVIESWLQIVDNESSN